LSTVTDCDKIIILDQGRVIEEGTHDELLAKTDGHYARIWTSQRTHRKYQEDKKEEVNVDGKQVDKYEKKSNEEPLQK
jgi:ABC-type multidrug transport system ATPase subunit